MMPNWCINELQINGTEEENNTILEFIRSDEEEISFNKIKPMPTDLGEGEWYNWCVSNWGTKWEASETSSNGNYVFFDTAWAPPIDAITALSSLYPVVEMVLSFYEPGMLFAGYATFKNGDFTEVTYGDGGEEYYRFVFLKGFEDEDNYIRVNGEYMYSGSMESSDDGRYLISNNTWNKNKNEKLESSEFIMYDTVDDTTIECEVYISEDIIAYINDEVITLS